MKLSKYTQPDFPRFGRKAIDRDRAAGCSRGTPNGPRSKNGIYMHEIRTNLFVPQIVGIYLLPRHYGRYLETSFACPHQVVTACWLTTWVLPRLCFFTGQRRCPKHFRCTKALLGLSPESHGNTTLGTRRLAWYGIKAPDARLICVVEVPRA